MNISATRQVEVLPALEVEQRNSRRPFLTVRHPGYGDSDNNNVLLTLIATDGTSDAPGIQYGLVHTACAIITNNRFDGYLTASRQPSASGSTERPVFDYLLPVGNYFFHLPTAAPADISTPPIPNEPLTPYAIVPNFAHWAFPHDHLPDPWNVAPIAAATLPPVGPRARDVTCRLTKHDSPTESAHIIPAAEKVWFGTNGMERYAPDSLKRGEEIVNAEENIILLRQDVHTLWDFMKLSLVPKSNSARWVWAVHLNAWSPVQHDLYHNHSLQQLTGVRREYLFARFAWDVFPKLQPFLQKHVKRRIVVRDSTGVHELITDDLDEFCQNQGKLRSSRSSRKSASSSSKRRRSNDNNHDTQSFDSGIELSQFGGKEFMEATDNSLLSSNNYTFGQSAMDFGDGIDEEDASLRIRRCEIAFWAREHENEVDGFDMRRRKTPTGAIENGQRVESRGRKRWRG